MPDWTCTRAKDPASAWNRAFDKSGSTGDAICKVQKIAPTMNPASSLAVHAPENRADKKKTWQTDPSTWEMES